MIKQRVLGGLLLAALLAPAFANRLVDQVGTMSEAGRAKFTGMLIRQTGAQCPAVTRTFFQGKLDDKSQVWNVSCNSRDNYGVVFSDDAANTTRVMKCAELKSLGAPDCFKKF